MGRLLAVLFCLQPAFNTVEMDKLYTSSAFTDLQKRVYLVKFTVPAETALSLIIWIILDNSSLRIISPLTIRFLGRRRSSRSDASWHLIFFLLIDNLIWLWSSDWCSWLHDADRQTRLREPWLVGDSGHLLKLVHLPLFFLLTLFLFHRCAPALVAAETAAAWALWKHPRALAYPWLFLFFFYLRHFLWS